MRLHTAIDDEQRLAAESSLATLNVNVTVVDRDEPVAFRYFTPVAPPTIEGAAATHAQTITADDDAVLVFGMIETGHRDIRSRRAVVDPQRPRDLQVLNLQGIQADELAVVLNAREARALTGGTDNLRQAAHQLLARTTADIIVVKDSGRGCLIQLRGADTAVRVGPFPTRSVWPLGSGDVFAAGFAHAWNGGAHPIEAARVASSCAAFWCATRRSRLPVELLAGTPVNTVLDAAAPELTPAESTPTIYLAGPFFSVAERWLVETSRAVLAGLGASVFSPLHDVGLGGDEVAAPDLEGLRQADAVFALLDGWDPGTVYEVGWAHHNDLPVVGFLNAPVHEGSKMLVGAGAELHDDLSSALYRAVWAAQSRQVEAGRIQSPW
ncbi:MAG: PfkB family carbohydrate kinase [Mycobacterium kyogaense]|uniref:PfkB family carbohydrate kinase n=1 Tax=Mycobacterium kyogaense TaxID=2212479 RepID=UPI002FFB172D